MYYLCILIVVFLAAIDQSLQESVFATALAVAFFTMKLAGEKDVWELVVLKAKKWMAKQIEKSEEILKFVESFF